MLRIFYESPCEVGVRISSLKFGTIVRRANAGDTLYLVVSLMDGSGLRHLVTLGGGTIKQVDQSTMVIPLEATLTVHGVDYGVYDPGSGVRRL